MADDLVATRQSWENQPFGEVCAVPYRRSFSAAECARIERGLIPKAMEDKWFIYFDAPALFLHRSWTGMGAYRVELAPEGHGAAVTQAWCAVELVDANGAAYHAQLLEFLIGNLLLGEDLPFPKPSDLAEPMPGVLQHVVSGTGYPERAVARAPERRPWWRFWR